MKNACSLSALPVSLPASLPVALPLTLSLLLLASCSSGSGWTHASLTEAQQQQQMTACNEQAIAAEKTYYAENSRGEANSASPFINNLKVRQRSIAARTEVYDACMLAAGFAR